jgi:hypothetical protein
MTGEVYDETVATFDLNIATARFFSIARPRTARDEPFQGRKLACERYRLQAGFLLEPLKFCMREN